MNNFRDQLKRFIEPIQRRLILMIARAVVKEIDDSKSTQEMKISAYKNEVRSSVQRFQNYGLTSNPLPDSEAVVIFPNGNRDMGLIIAVDDRRYRLKNLAPGEVALYTDEGDYVHFKRGNKIEIKTSELTITSPLTKITGNLEVGGTSLLTGLVTAPGGVLAAGGLSAAGAPTAATVNDAVGDLGEIRSVYNSHTHNENGDGGGVTSGPNQTIS